MKKYFLADPWKIIETDFDLNDNKVSESVFSIGNGRMGQRANFEETFSGSTLKGSYLAGVYYPDKTRVGWWKNGYPEYFAKVVNSLDWLNLKIVLDDTELDLGVLKPLNYRAELDMEKGLLARSFELELHDGILINIQTQRFYSQTHPDAALMRYRLRVMRGEVDFTVTSGLEASVQNEDANYDEMFWEAFSAASENNRGFVSARTKKTNFRMASAVYHDIRVNGQSINGTWAVPSDSNVEATYSTFLSTGDEVILNKYVSIQTSFFYPDANLIQSSKNYLEEILEVGYDDMLEQQILWWQQRWEQSDIVIEGDVEAQQGIRFNIFQLNQTYNGEHPGLNIGPKGFTGEKYGGSTYWDTEAYCLPYYLATATSNVARQLLQYRYNHLPQAIDNAKKLGFDSGAALYPMVTMNGEECHNEWEITFEEIHRNGAIAYAIYDYTRYTGDRSYLLQQGVEVLLAIARFWKQRVNWSEAQQKYVMLGVTGPNEYENNVNNNWYTNYIAAWCMEYAAETLESLKTANPAHYDTLKEKTGFQESELSEWQAIRSQLYFPYDEGRKVFLQQDGFLDKELVPVAELDAVHLPLNQQWSWDRILRSCYIKQADVLQGLYFFEDRFDIETIKRNFSFYEPLTVHESSLSPCIHAILAARIGDYTKAYEMYLRTARLDLDNYNTDTEDGLHITSMAGTWLAVVKGFGGMSVDDNGLHLHPILPPRWKNYTFRILYSNRTISVKVQQATVTINNLSAGDLTLSLYNERHTIVANGQLSIARPAEK